jgi:hypothetical protein
MDGAFAVPVVEPGRYWLRVAKTGYATQIVPIEQTRPDERLEVRIVLEHEASIILTPHDERGSVPACIRVQVCDEQGHVVRGYGTRRGWFSPPQEDEEVTVGQLSPGRCRLVAFAEGYAPVRVEAEVAAGAPRRVDLPFTSGRRLGITVCDDRGDTVPGALAYLDAGGHASLAASYPYRTAGADGRAALGNVADGNYTLRVRCEGYEDASVTVSIAGGDEEVTVTLQRRPR